jgi:hypothetical protein
VWSDDSTTTLIKARLIGLDETQLEYLCLKGASANLVGDLFSLSEELCDLASAI